ncbi:MAG: efflux RND transporter permease subunit [Saprospiraceae bacterium]|nr:efflux RND transporter permease subunit [Saprospiraceae bacterium]
MSALSGMGGTYYSNINGMNQLITIALRRPLSIIVAVLAILLFSFLALRKMPIDIFPKLGLPTIYVAQTYGGLSPQQMEGFITSYYEYHFLYVTGIKFVESKSIQGATLIKLQFQPETDMNQAIAEVISYANRAKAFMPPGTVPPFVMRFDAGSVPVGQLVFSCDSRTLGEIQDLALFKVRPMFATLQGVSAPPPFGGNQRTVVVKANPERLRSYGISPEDLVQALAKNNLISAAGNIRIGDQNLISPQNTVVENFKELENIPIKPASGTSIYVRDVASVDNGADITTGYAYINGKRSVYIPVTKRADASTWDVVQRIKTALPDMQVAIPADIKVSYEFDQSGYVINALKNLMTESLLGAILTGLMVLLFLKDIRGALIVVLTIPLAMLFGVICLYLTGQTLNIMTLGGLALSVGILVDEATVTIENIHRHLEMGKPKSRAIADASREIAYPKLLILLCVLAVFVPALFMSGTPRSLFVPLSLAVGFSMIASFLLSQTLVPVLSNWFLKNHYTISDLGFGISADAPNATEIRNPISEIRSRYQSILNKNIPRRAWIVPIYLLLAFAATFLIYKKLGADIFPKSNSGQFVLRLRMPAGTRLERTEDVTQKVLGIINELSGNKKGTITSAFAGVQGQSYPVNLIHLWTSGSHESVLRVNLDKDFSVDLADFEEKIRQRVATEIPKLQLSFEAGNLVEQVINLGSSNPIEIAILGKNLKNSRDIVDKLLPKLKENPHLRDVQLSTPLDYPSLKLNYDRTKAGQLGLTVDEISRNVIAATSSSRLTQPNYWLDAASGNAYQIQVELPQYQLNSTETIEQIPVSSNGKNEAYLRDVADWTTGNTVGEYDRLNQQRYLTITANLHHTDLQKAIQEVQSDIKALGKLPEGVKVNLRGQSELFDQTQSELMIGLLLSIIVIFLLMAANFQSFRLATIILAIVPAVLLGAFFLLFLTGKTLNIQSFMGCITAIGVAVANAILMITQAELLRKQKAENIASQSAASRFRPILMTSLAMIAGLVPMALGLGEGGEQAAPLGIAVIGGMLFSTPVTLLILPLLYSFVQKRLLNNISLDPDDVGFVRE